MLAPLLYMLALAGVGATVMFSGYSQILKSNAEMTALNAARAQLQAAGQTLSAYFGSGYGHQQHRGAAGGAALRQRHRRRRCAPADQTTPTPATAERRPTSA